MDRPSSTCLPVSSFLACTLIVAARGGSDHGSDAAPPTSVTVGAAPVVTTQPRSATVVSGASVTLSAVVSGTSVTDQWTRDGTPIAGATGASYTIGSVTPGVTTGTYVLIATNASGATSSSPATVSVGSVSGAPAITLQPVSVDGQRSLSTGLTVVATGRDLAYQWFLNGSPIVGATGPNLGFSIDPTNVGNYTVTVANGSGSVTSATAVVTMGSAARVFVPAIDVQPTPRSVASGTGVTLGVQASTFGGAIAYQWYRDGAPIAGATASTFVIPAASAASAGIYRAVLSVDGGSVASAPARVSVDTPVVAPTITVQPRSMTVPVSTPVSFTVSATGTDLVYQWYSGGGTSRIPGATDATYAIPNPVSGSMIRSDGDYRVIVSNGAGSATSQIATLAFGPGSPTLPSLPAFTVQPVSLTGAAGASLTLAAAAGPDATYQWYQDGRTLVGATGASYTVASMSASAVGAYYVVASNAGGRTASATARLDLAR